MTDLFNILGTRNNDSIQCDACATNVGTGARNLNDVSPSFGVETRGCALINPLSPAASHRVFPPNELVRPRGDLSWR